jgi:alkanesulfonate monooxygenase SsuD/methylene tetrahydromethanopterin reductase-like flavin-dependent oxidoreductase (luciferase family)
MAIFNLRYDLRRPEFARASSAELAQAAIEQCEFADRHGFLSATLSEHHGSPDGYLPSPLVLAAAIAARTRQVRLMIAALIAPLHDPIRIAEDLAVVDVISNGRLIPVLAAGYVASEFATFGRDLGERGRLLDEAVEVLKRAWTGEPFEYRGRTVRVTPRPVQQPRPPIFLGGSTRAAARRAARIADYLIPSTPDVFETYRAELNRLGKPDPGPLPPSTGNFVHVAEDPDAAWRHIAPHALHETNAYGRWLADAGLAGPYRQHRDADSLRASGQYLVLTPDELVARARALGPAATITLHPLMGGLHPDHGWESLRLVVEKVMPALAQ